MAAVMQVMARSVRACFMAGWLAAVACCVSSGCERSAPERPVVDTSSEEIEWLGVRLSGVSRERLDERHYRVRYTVANLHALPVRVHVVAQFYVPGDDPETAAARQISSELLRELKPHEIRDEEMEFSFSGILPDGLREAERGVPPISVRGASIQNPSIAAPSRGGPQSFAGRRVRAESSDTNRVE
jgi:hypothetical protein